MTVSTTTTSVEYAGNGSATVFSVPFPVLDDGDLAVYLVQDSDSSETLQVMTTHYTVTTGAASGSVTMLTAPPSGYTLRVESAIALTQPDTLRTQGRYDPRTVERMHDRHVLQMQQLDRDKVSHDDLTGLLEDYAALPADASVRTDLATATASKGAALVAWKRTATGAVQRTLAELAAMQVRHINEFKTNASDATTAAILQAAIDSFGPEGGILDIDESDILISTTVWVKYPVWIRCRGASEISTNSNGSGGGLTTFNWTGADGGCMFFFCARAKASIEAASTNSEILFGGGITGALLVGRSGAGVGANTGVWLASTNNVRLDIKAYSFKSEAVLIDGGNGVVGQHNEVKLHMTWGVDTAFSPMHGVRLRRYNGATATQTDLWVEGLADDGDHIKLEDTDNNRIWFCHGSIQPGGLCKGIHFNNGAGVLPAQNNVVYYAACNVHFGSQTKGNRLLHHISEAGSITVDSGAIAHFEAVDYVDGGLFSTTRYKMYDLPFFPAKLWTGTDTLASSVVPAKDMADGVTTTVGLLIAGPLDWNDGTILALAPRLSCDAAAAGNVRLQVRISSLTPGTDLLSSVEYTEAFTVTPSANANQELNLPVTFATPLPYVRGQSLLILLDRVGADAADTKAATVKFLGASVEFKCAGPNSPGSGTYALPSRGA